MTTITGQFNNTNNDTITVTIVSQNGNEYYTIGERQDLYFASEPVIIETECEDMFTTILKKSCKISLVTSLYLGDTLFAANEKSITCKVYKNGTIVFDGYVEPNTYTQPYAHQLEQFDLNCIDKLGCLQYEYLADQSSWADMKEAGNIWTFEHYLTTILGSNIYWDESKKVSNNSIFSMAGVSMDVFLGEDEDDMMTNEDVLHEILQYCNLHIIQEGSNFVIFDWNTIINSTTSSFKNISNSTYISIPTYIDNITKDRYASDDTNLSMSEVYNQVQITCETEDVDEIISSPLDDNDVLNYNNYPRFGSKFLREYISRDEDVFKDLLTQGVNGALPDNTNEDWKIREWFFKWIYNPHWTLKFKNSDIANIAEYSGSQIINEWNILKALKDNKFMPALLSVGKSKDITHKEHVQDVEINLDNYFVISTNGDEADSETALDNIDDANKQAANYKSTSSISGLLTYNSNKSSIYSPAEDKVTNYLVFNGRITLNPIMKMSGWGYVYDELGNQPPAQNLTFGQQYQAIVVDERATGPWCDIDDLGHYSHQYYKCTNTSESIDETPDNDVNFIYPFVNQEQFKLYKYRYSVNGDNTDRIDILPVLLCMLKIGDKYLVQQNSTYDGEKADYKWMTLEEANDAGLENTFSLGFDPKFDDYIIGKEYELANTVNGRISSEKGTAVKITKDDNLVGQVEFKVLGIINTIWNDVTRKHPTMFRHTSYQNNYKVLMNYVSSIWVKDFKVKIISDMGNGAVANEAKDIIYMSNEQKDYIKKKDDITFKINTALSNEEYLNLGIENNVSNTNVINMSTNTLLTSITDTTTNQTDRAERLYIDQYYNLYNSPKLMLNSTLKDTTSYPFWSVKTMSGFSNMVPLKVSKNLKQNTIDITCRHA